jgi:hypothetical protein
MGETNLLANNKLYKDVNNRVNLLVNVKEGEHYLYPPKYIDDMIEKFSKIIKSDEKLKDKVIIYFVGGHREGKSSLARQLRSSLSNSYLLSLSRPIKLIIDKMFPKEFIQAKPPEMRRLYQSFGEAKRAVTLNYFLNIYLSTLKGESSEIRYVITDDVYHINERILMHLFDKVVSVKFEPRDLSMYYAHNPNPNYDTARESVKQLKYLLEEYDYDIEVPKDLRDSKDVSDKILEMIQKF